MVNNICDFCAGTANTQTIELLYRNRHYVFCCESCLTSFVNEIVYAPYIENRKAVVEKFFNEEF